MLITYILTHIINIKNEDYKLFKINTLSIDDI
jgi:hypothetical protein